MKEIRKRIKPYYDERKHSLSIAQFVLFETALMVVEYFKPDADPCKGYILLTKYQNIGKRDFTPDSYILQNAGICLKKYRSEKIWKDTLQEYSKEEYKGIRLFEVAEDRLIKEDKSNLIYADREQDYMRYIRSYSSDRSGKYAVSGRYKYYNKNNENQAVTVELEEDMTDEICSTPREAKPREKIVITMSQLFEAAEEMQEKMPGDHCANVLKSNFIKEVTSGNVKPVEKIELNKVTNIVGMVGAGKTTLLKAMAYSLDKMEKRVVVVTDTVAEVFNLYRYFLAFQSLLSAWIDVHESDLVLEDAAKTEEVHKGKSKKELEQIRKETEKNNKKKIKLRKEIELILTLIYFDKFVMAIGEAYEDTQDTTLGYNELVGFIRTRFTAQQDYLPSALMGNLFGIKSTEEDDVLLFRQYAYGRALLTDLPYLRVNKEGVAVGPHVVLLSGSSYAEGSYEYHVNAEVNYIVEAGQAVREFIAKTQFVELGLEERVSGSPLESREEILKRVVDKCTLNIISELKKEGKILLVVNSFSQAEVVASHLQANLLKRGCEERVCAMISDRSKETYDSDKYIRRGEVYKFDQNKARILVAPALAIERGHNIVDEQGHSSLSSVFFLIRPMGVPDDVKEKSIKMNGYLASKLFRYKNTDIYEKNLYVRREATKFWERMNISSKRSLEHLGDMEIKTDLVATMFVLILQIFGRLCRVTDQSKTPPTVYFVDGAFRKREKSEEGFDTLNELYLYLKNMISDAENGAVARTLYEPFFTAYEGGIQHE